MKSLALVQGFATIEISGGIIFIFLWGRSPLRAGFFAKFDNKRNTKCDVFANRASIAFCALVASFAQRSRATPKAGSHKCKTRR
jgi:hypothetical protein